MDKNNFVGLWHIQVLLTTYFIGCESVCRELTLKGVPGHKDREGTYSLQHDFFKCSNKRTYIQDGDSGGKRAYFYFYIFEDGRRGWLLGTNPCGHYGVILQGKDDSMTPFKVNQGSWYEFDGVTGEWQPSRQIDIKCRDSKTLAKTGSIAIVVCILVAAGIITCIFIYYRSRRDRKKELKIAVVPTVSGRVVTPGASAYSAAVPLYRVPNSASYPTPSGYEQLKEDSISGSRHSRGSSTTDFNRQTSV